MSEELKEKELAVSSEEDYVSQIVALVREEKNDETLKEKLGDYHESDIADAYELLTLEEHKRLYDVLGADLFSEIFAYVEDAHTFLEEMPVKTAAEVLGNMDADDAVDILDEVDDEKEAQLLKLMDSESSEDIALIRSFEEDEIGCKMTTNFVSVPKTYTIKEAMKSLVTQAGENDNITTIYAVDEHDRFYGAIALKDLIVARQGVELESLISTNYPYLYGHEKIDDCLARIKDYTEDSIPVLDNDDVLLGVITAQDIVETVDEELNEDYARLAGLTSAGDLDEPLHTSLAKRLPWLLGLMLLALGISAVVGIFEHVVASLAVLVCFQSIVLSMAGNVGTQTVAVTIRSLSGEQMPLKEKVRLVFKELRIGLCNGVILGLIAFLGIGLYVCFVKGGYNLTDSFSISACVGLALFCAMLIASLLGTLIPLFFNRIGVDPAIASGPLITTLNDLVAVVTYYGLCWILLLNVLHLGS